MVIFFFLPFLPVFPNISEKLIIPTLAPGIPGISKLGKLAASFISTSISLLSKSPFLSLFLKLSLVATLALFPTNASRTFSSACFCA